MIADPTFAYLQQFLRRRCGLDLDMSRRYLLDTRLARLMREDGFSGLDALAIQLRGQELSGLGQRVVEAMVTNETYFFRDRLPFEHLRNSLLPELLVRRAEAKTLRIWCAGASTGQEPYSIAMILDDLAPRFEGWQIDIVGTDISLAVMERARAGVYSQFEVQRGLPIRQLLKHFTRVGEDWQISQRLRAMVRFEVQNLMRANPEPGAFDIVFCRNVLIYFDAATRQDAFSRLARSVAPDGTMILGGAETVLRFDSEFEPDRDLPGVARRMRGRAGSAAIAGGAACHV